MNMGKVVKKSENPHSITRVNTNRKPTTIAATLSHIGSGSSFISSIIFIQSLLFLVVDPNIVRVLALLRWTLRQAGSETPASVYKVVKSHSSTE